jgi:hypothetical protein
MNALFPEPLAQRGAAPLARRIALLRADIDSAREKERRLRESIQLRQTTLNRLQTRLALWGESGAARFAHEKSSR